MKCKTCECTLPVEGNRPIIHLSLLDCSIALAAAQGAVNETLLRVAEKLGEKQAREYATKHNLTNLL
jgi:hypothetical protein